MSRRLSGRILAEAEDHLRETADRLREQGVSSEEAEYRAVARFGTPAEITAGFSSEQNTWEVVMMLLAKLSTTLLVGITSFICLGVVVHTFWGGSVEPTWGVLRSILGSAVIVSGALTVRYLWTRGSGSAVQFLAVAAGLVLLGAASVINAVRIARVTGDWEYYIITMGLALICQGMLTVWISWKLTPKEA